MRGVEEHSTTVTTAWRGAYADAALRQEFLQLVAHRHGP
jgi:GTP cyclohydrolase I